jgi:hypothetical protein
MFYVYAPTLYAGTRDLIDAFKGKRLVRHDGLNFLLNGKPLTFNEDDVILCWGSHVPPVAPALMLNASAKHRDALQMNCGMSKVIQALTFGYLPWTKMHPLTYANTLEYLRKSNWTITKAAIKLGGGYIPLREKEPFGTSYKRVEWNERVIVVGGKPVGPITNPQAAAVATDVTHMYALEIAAVSVFFAEGYPWFRKINTSPELGKLLPEFVTAVTTYIQSKRVV